MKVIDTPIPDVKIIEPKVFGDERGFFLESFNRRRFHELTGLDMDFVQDNYSKSGCGVLRGLHYQIEQAQGKLVRVFALAAEGLLEVLRASRSGPVEGGEDAAGRE